MAHALLRRELESIEMSRSVRGHGMGDLVGNAITGALVIGSLAMAGVGAGMGVIAADSFVQRPQAHNYGIGAAIGAVAGVALVQVFALTHPRPA